MIQPAFDPAVFGVPTDTLPISMTINWDALDPIGYSRTLRELAAWVERFRQAYRVPATVFAPCWFAHPGIREEPGHLWTGWLTTIHADAGVGMIGLDWDSRRDQVVSRLRESRVITGCTAGAHREERPLTIHPATELLVAHLTHECQTRSKNAVRIAAEQVVLEHLQGLELRHDLAARLLVEIVETRSWRPSRTKPMSPSNSVTPLQTPKTRSTRPYRPRSALSRICNSPPTVKRT